MANRLYRSKNDRKISGVCGGIAEYFRIDPTIVRLLWLISIVAYGTGLIIYIGATIIIPEREGSSPGINLRKDSDETDKSYSGTSNANFDEEKNKKLLGYGLIVIGLIFFSKKFVAFQWLNFKFLFPALLIFAGVVILAGGFKK